MCVWVGGWVGGDGSKIGGNGGEGVVDVSYVGCLVRGGEIIERFGYCVAWCSW